jgi:hypothetical protein
VSRSVEAAALGQRFSAREQQTTWHRPVGIGTGHVRRLDSPVLAAGDATDFPSCEGGQARAAPGRVASPTGATINPRPFHSRPRAKALSYGEPLQLSEQLVSGHVFTEPRWSRREAPIQQLAEGAI